MSWRLPRPRVPLPPQFGHAARVALAATLLVGVVYAGCVTILDRAVSARLVASVDARLRQHLATAAPAQPGASTSRAATGQAAAGQAGTAQGGIGQTATARKPHPDDDDDVDEAPVFLWQARPGQAAVALTAGAPALPAGRVPLGGGPVTAPLGPSTFRLDQARHGGAWLVAGQSLADQQHTMNVLRGGEALVGPVLLLAMFAGSLIIGLRAMSPVEQSRRRQLEFTADASHELRTPLSVISAEIGIALSAPRAPPDYQAALLRIEGESQRLRRIVEDLLWLARFDSEPPPPGAEPLDLCTIAGQCADRFRAVAYTQSLDISVTTTQAQAAWISAPPEWIDRLTGVLVDNACRYAGPGGSVRLGVTVRGNRVSLTVEDSGPGIPAAERPRLFDRFHRATELGGGAGLGLAIADSIVRSTGGHWRIGESPLGGALFEVSWRRSGARAHGGGPQAAPEPDPVTAGGPPRSGGPLPG
ncbi:MAG: two-component system, OmpR family, sensor kinase [Streptosporangiaceae bacterium]|nr:two-component system, OmpR family, sensor kinase [Streptosporangiaceae bacterium]